MNYLYHWVPKNMKGNILMPLNVLKKQDLELYNQYFQKYKGRETVTHQYLPTLQCLWNDVLHFTAVHPKDVKDALIESGGSNSINIECYQIDASILDSEKTTVYFSGDKPENRMKLKNFEKYDYKNINHYSNIPQKTKDYYKECFSNNKKPLVFHCVPHILYKGTINVSNINIVKV